MNKTLSVSAIKNGTVIDHIPPEQVLKIIHLLDVFNNTQQITVGLNLKSNRLGVKGLIKIESRILNKAEIDKIAIFAPKASINVIEDFEVKKKIRVKLPSLITDVLICPHVNCISRFEPVNSCFSLESYGKRIQLTCKYCEKQFDRDQLVKRSDI